MSQLVRSICFYTRLRNVCFSIAFAITLVFPPALLAHNSTFDPGSGGLYIPTVEVPNPFGTGVDCYQIDLSLTSNGTFSLAGAVPTDCGGVSLPPLTGPSDGSSCSQFSVGTPDYNRCQTARLQGTWSFNFTLINEFNNIYTLTDIEEASLYPGEFNIWGVSEYDDNVIAGYDPEYDDFSILAYSSIEGIQEFLSFNFTSEDTVSGCFFLVIDMVPGDCYDTIGTRISRAANNVTDVEKVGKMLEEHRTLEIKGNAPKAMNKGMNNHYKRLRKELTNNRIKL